MYKYLASKLVAGEGKDAQAIGFILLVKLHQFGVVHAGQTSLASHIDYNARIAPEKVKENQFPLTVKVKIKLKVIKFCNALYHTEKYVECLKLLLETHLYFSIETSLPSISTALKL